MSHVKLARSLARAATQAHQTASHCGVTIAARLPVFAGALIAPSESACAEWNRAYTEKVMATWEGAFAASLEWQAALMRSAVRPPSPAGLAHDMMRVMQKAAEPARRSVKANAKRLAGPKSSKR